MESEALHQLIDVALCTPQVGAVNFNILRNILHEIVQRLTCCLPNKPDDPEKTSKILTQNLKYSHHLQGTRVPFPGHTSHDDFFQFKSSKKNEKPHKSDPESHDQCQEKSLRSTKIKQIESIEKLSVQGVGIDVEPLQKLNFDGIVSSSSPFVCQPNIGNRFSNCDPHSSFKVPCPSPYLKNADNWNSKTCSDPGLYVCHCQCHSICQFNCKLLDSLIGKSDEADFGAGDMADQELIKSQWKKLTILPNNLDSLRRHMKISGKIPNFFDEHEILERIYTLWDAVNVLNQNDELMAIRMIKLDSRLSCRSTNKISISSKGIENIQKSKSENVKGTLIEDEMNLKCSLSESVKVIPSPSKKLLEDITKNMVTKSMLILELQNKADKIWVEKYFQEVSQKIDNGLRDVERKNFRDDLNDLLQVNFDDSSSNCISTNNPICDIQNYFKSLEEKIEQVSNQVKSIQKKFMCDSGTRRDCVEKCKCHKCSGQTNICGVISSSRLQTFAPSVAGHSNVGQRTFNLCSMRPQMREQFWSKGRNMNLVSKELSRSRATPYCPQTHNILDSSLKTARFAGGSHTVTTTRDRVAAMTKHKQIPRSSTGKLIQRAPTKSNLRPQTYDGHQRK